MAGCAMRGLFLFLRPNRLISSSRFEKSLSADGTDLAYFLMLFLRNSQNLRMNKS
jgi:hypothetical protein